MRFADCRQFLIGSAHADALPITASAPIVRDKPVNLKQEDAFCFASDKKNPVTDFYPSIRSLVTIVYYGTVFQKGKILTETYPFPFSTFRRHYISVEFVARQWARRVVSKRKASIREGIWLIDLWSSNYFHWFTETLPRLVRNQKLAVSGMPVVLSRHCRNKSYIFQSLHLFGVTNIVTLNRYEKVSVQELHILPPIVASGNVDSKTIRQVGEFIREHFLTKSRKKKRERPERIFISRKNARCRRILNEENLIEILEKYDFKIVMMEDLPWEEQVKTMLHAKILIGAHGAGMANMLFMPEGSAVLEMLPRRLDGTINNCYYNLASALGMKYHYQFRSHQDKSGVPDGGDANIIVSEAIFERNLVQIISNESF